MSRRSPKGVRLPLSNCEKGVHAFVYDEKIISFFRTHIQFLDVKKSPEQKHGGDLLRHNFIFPPKHNANSMKNLGDPFLDTFLEYHRDLLDTFFGDLEFGTVPKCSLLGDPRWTPFLDG